jgi:hypothetical protein
MHSASPHFHFGAASLRLTCDMWILTAPNPAVVPVYNSSDHGMLPRLSSTLGRGNRVTPQFFLTCSERSLCVLLGHSALVDESFEILRLSAELFV